ncbi:hypothetical protein FACS1894184_14680 [Clostridia bacterium]|nr:hypothetical protein FACS1894184_14680 [Clostridia bacterium]
MSTYKQWEVYWAYVPYKEGKGGKDRPVVVISQGECQQVMMLYLTTSKPNNDYDTLIKEWKKSGLTESTYTRVARRYPIESITIHQRIGRLMRVDQLGIADALASYDSLGNSY